MSKEEKRLMMSEEEVIQRANELLNLPKEHLIAQYMFLEQDVQKYKEVIDKLKEELVDSIPEKYEIAEYSIKEINDILKEVK